MGPCKLGACKVERVRLSRVNVRNVSLGWRPTNNGTMEKWIPKIVGNLIFLQSGFSILIQAKVKMAEDQD